VTTTAARQLPIGELMVSGALVPSIVVVVVATVAPARGDDVPPGATAPTAPAATPVAPIAPAPMPTPNIPISLLEVAVRAGAATLSYDNEDSANPCPGEVEMSGAGWFVDGEVGLRWNKWTFGGFASYLSHEDTTSGPGGWNIQLRVTEIGARVTWHSGRFSIGAGLMPWLQGHQWGMANAETSYGSFVFVPYSVDEKDRMIGAELHFALDLLRVNAARVQLFGLIETTSAQGDNIYSLTSARLGAGLAF
jgi:hypothetical protein